MQLFVRSSLALSVLLVCAGCGGQQIPTADGGTDAGSDVGPPNCARVFLTAGTYKGDLGGTGSDAFGKADQLCQAAATQAGMTGVTFKAYLSNQTTDAFDRLSFDGPYCATAASGAIGKQLFSNKATWKANPLGRLTTDELGRKLPGDDLTRDFSYSGSCSGGSSYSLSTPQLSFWFGSTPTGTKESENCSGWTSPIYDYCAPATRGFAGYFDLTPKIYGAKAPCGLTLHLLCFEAK